MAEIPHPNPAPRIAYLSSILEKAFTQADYAINITDKNGVLLKVNQAYLDVYKFKSEADVLGKTQSLIRSPHTPDSVYKDMWQTILRGETWRGNISNLAQDGTEVFAHLTITPIREDGVIIGYMGFSLDRAQQVLLEKELFHANKLMVVATMGAGLAHELNNPLASILLDSEYLNDVFSAPNKDFDWATAASAAHSVIQGVERMKRVLEHLLLYSRKDSGHKFSTLSADQLIQDSFLFIERQLRSRSIDIDIDIDRDIYLSCNQTQLESVIHNLLSNSRDAFEGREGEKLIRIHGYLENPKLFLMEYWDNAGGISPQNLARIFEPFFTTKMEKEGTGLGLAISHKIVAEHGGGLTCASENGTTTFRMTLPCIPQSAHPD